MHNKQKIIKMILSIVLLFVLILLPNNQYNQYYLKATAATIKLNSKSIFLNIGDSKTLTLTGTNKSITWSSSNKSIVTVSSKGKVTAKKIGEAIITALVSGKKYRCEVSVLKPHIRFKTLNVNLSEAQSNNYFEYIKVYSYFGSEEQKWISSDESIVSIGDNGVLSIHKIGSAVLSTTLENVIYKCTVTVTDYSDEYKMAAYGLIMLDYIINDPSSLTINAIYHTKTDESSDKQDVVVIDYTATNGFGGRVRNYASIFTIDEILNLGYTLETSDLGYVLLSITDTRPSSETGEFLNTDDILNVKDIKKQNHYKIYY